MNATIIVPLDGSPLAEQALPLAARLAQGLNAELRLTHVIDPMATRITYHEGIPWTIEDERRHMQTNSNYYLTYVKDTWCNTGVTIDTEVVEGGIGEAITTLTQQHQAAYIVMTTHAKTGLARVALGSVADYVMRQSTCPVILIPPHQLSRPVHLAPLRNILVPLDGSLFAETALAQAKSLARTFNAKLHLYRVTTAVPAPMLYPQRIPMPTPLADETYAINERYLDHIQTQLLLEGFHVDSHLGIGTPGDAILAHADAIGADLIAMSTHARTGLSRTILGSTADHVVRAGSRPVLLVHPE
jgi:nucleotide-binding universal stress UspA family protein